MRERSVVKLTAMSAFILAGRKKLLPEPVPSPSEHYDPMMQLWIDSASGTPLIETFGDSPSASKYGETTMTETREGADQSESTIHASSYGETTITKTREGADQSEATVLGASQYGETSHTATREGADQAVRILGASSYGETTYTRTREGADQTEITMGTGGLYQGQTSSDSLSSNKTPSSAYAPDPHF